MRQWYVTFEKQNHQKWRHLFHIFSERIGIWNPQMPNIERIMCIRLSMNAIYLARHNFESTYNSASDDTDQ
jgi:hypothetical protein